MIVDTECRPLPPSDIVKRVKQVDPSLGMYWSQNAAGGAWCYTEKWSENDPRREFIRAGKASPDMDFDIMGFAPAEMGAEDAFGYLVKALRNRPQTKADYNEMLNRVTNFNAVRSVENLKPTTDFAQEMVETNAKTLWRNEGKSIPKVYQNESTAKKSRWGK